MVDKTTPLLHYFEAGNIFSGSDKEKRYKVFPDKEGGMTCKIWIGPYCLEKTDPALVAEKAFSVTEDGRQAMIDWINSFSGTDK